jgi:type IV secretion system protein TrbI
MTNLSANVKTRGLAKNKILVVLGVLGAILISAVAFGILTTEKDNNKMNETTNLAAYQDNSNNTDQLLHDILTKKQNTSAAITESVVNLSPINSAALEIVPPIIKNSKEISSEEQAAAEYNKKQLSRKYVSYGAKSLMYSNAPDGAGSRSNTSASVSDFQSVSPNNGIMRQGVSDAVSMESAQDTSTNTKAQKQFIENSKTANTEYLASSLNDARSPYEVKAGSIIPATMINGLNSDLPGQIIAQVRESVYDSSTRRYLLIPQGAKLVGLYDNNIIYGQERILVAWNRLIYPDGSSINLKAMPGTDIEGYSGFYDEVDNKYWKLFGSSFIMGVITGAMQYSQNSTNANVQAGGISVTTNNNPTVGQTLSGSLGQQLGQTGLSITGKNLNVQPTLIVKPNYPFNIMLTADMILRPLPGGRINSGVHMPIGGRNP